MLKANNSGALYHSIALLVLRQQCGHRQRAEPSTTEAQRLQAPRTRDEPKTEKTLARTEQVYLQTFLCHMSEFDRCQSLRPHPPL